MALENQLTPHDRSVIIPPHNLSHTPPTYAFSSLLHIKSVFLFCFVFFVEADEKLHTVMVIFLVKLAP